MIGSALGIAIISSLLSQQTIRRAIDAVSGAAALPDAVRSGAIAQIQANGVSFAPLPGLSAADAATLRDAIDQAVISAARTPLIFATVVVTIGTLLSFLIPRSGPLGTRQRERPSATSGSTR